MNASTVKEVADGVFAYLQQGSWGFSNAGFVAASGATLLIDTLYDLSLTQRMLQQLKQVSGAAAKIDTVVNTHANGDHCWGNQLVADANIVSSRAAAEEMLALSPKAMHAMVQAARSIVKLGGLASVPLRLLSRLGLRQAGDFADAAPFLVDKFGSFDFGRVSLRAPNSTFEGRLSLSVGTTEVQLIEVGPAHTRGDVIVYLPAQRVLFSGDILFIGSHPIVWDGPIDNWIRACDVMLALDVDVVVPGHGSITDKRGVQCTKEYWQTLQCTALQAKAEGLSADDAVRVLLAKLAPWHDAERMVVNMHTALAEIGAADRRRDPLSLLAQMARHARSAAGR